MKSNFVAKHMNTFNKSSIHKDLKKEGIDALLEINQGLAEYQDKTDIETEQKTTQSIEA